MEQQIMMRLRMLIGVYSGKVREFPDEVGEHLLRAGFAEEVGGKPSASSIVSELVASPPNTPEVNIPRVRRRKR